jgi:hypothetical protein
LGLQAEANGLKSSQRMTQQELEEANQRVEAAARQRAKDQLQVLIGFNNISIIQSIIHYGSIYTTFY